MLTQLTGAHGVPHARAVPKPASRSEESAPLDLNAVVAYNFKAIRLVRGLTQEQVADRLAGFTGHRLPQASISQMERSFDGDRRRFFNSHELYLFSKVFDVPIVYFFLPPPACLDQKIANTGEALATVLKSLFGTSASLRAVDTRLIEIADRSLAPGASALAHDAAQELREWHFTASRFSEVDCNARLREIAHLLQELTDLHRTGEGAALH